MKIRINNKLEFLIVGILGAISFPPFNTMMPLLSVLSLSIFLSYMFYLIETSKSLKSCFVKVFLLTEISYLISYNWIMKPFSFVDMGWLFFVVAPIALLIFSSVLSLFVSLAGMLVYKVEKNKRFFAFAVFISFFEWVRGGIFTGFPWNPIALVWSDIPVVLQSASIIGGYGLSFLTVFVLTIPYLIYKKDYKNINIKIAVFISIIVLTFGVVRLFLSKAVSDDIDVKIKKVRLVDAGISQHKINSGEIFNYVSLPQMIDKENVDLFVLPETSSIYDISNDDYYKKIYANINNEKSKTIIGFNRYENIDMKNQTYDVYNSMGILDANGNIDVYDKIHLVPFGEYMPLKFLIPFEKFTQGINDFSKGKEHKIFDLDGFKFFPLICYEVIFSAIDIPDNVDAIVNISNDAWFSWFGKAQHLEIVKLRAVEYGLPIIRSANESVDGGYGTTIISKFGMVLTPEMQKEFENGAVVKDFFIKKRIGETFFDKINNIPFIIFVILGFLWSFSLFQYVDFTNKNIKK